jgi:hypothetical protein
MCAQGNCTADLVELDIGRRRQGQAPTPDSANGNSHGQVAARFLCLVYFSLWGSQPAVAIVEVSRRRLSCCHRRYNSSLGRGGAVQCAEVQDMRLIHLRRARCLRGCVISVVVSGHGGPQGHHSPGRRWLVFQWIEGHCARRFPPRQGSPRGGLLNRDPQALRGSYHGCRWRYRADHTVQITSRPSAKQSQQ